jgi:hypothetical protein
VRWRGVGWDEVEVGWGGADSGGGWWADSGHTVLWEVGIEDADGFLSSGFRQLLPAIQPSSAPPWLCLNAYRRSRPRHCLFRPLQVPTDSDDRPLQDIVITGATVFTNPFKDIIEAENAKEEEEAKKVGGSRGPPRARALG